jgi:methionyl aminopeptidase
VDEMRGRITRDGIRIYEDADFPGMRPCGPGGGRDPGCRRAAGRAGATTGEIDAFITAEVERHGVTSATIGYKGYQARRRASV